MGRTWRCTPWEIISRSPGLIGALSPATPLPRPVSGRVTSLARDGDRLWIGTQTGLAVLDLHLDEVRSVGGSERFAIHALTAGPGALWAGTDRGIFRCGRGNATWVPAESAEGPHRGRILALCAGGLGIWAAAQSPPGLLHLELPDSTWRHYPLAELHASRRVAVAADSARAWVATDVGVFRLDIARGLWKRYTRTDGLVHNQVQAVLLDGEYVWFGTAGGISRFQWNVDFFERD